jgi:His/Glu/Gln/Arg/opine family amino acid ABC transporter permease subunit
MQAGDYLALLQGAWTMLEIVLPAIAIGIPLGLLLALIRWRNVPGLSPLVAGLVSLFRATPSITLILLLYFAAPEIGLQPPELPAAIAMLTLGTMAYNCEIWRAALLAFPADQFDVALSLGMTRAVRFRLIVLPQIFARVCRL